MALLTNVLVGTVTDENGLVINVYATENGDGTFTLTATVESGYADLRGFFLDTDSDDSNDDTVTVGGSDNNMNGSGETFDEGYEIGTAGIGEDDISTWSHTFTGSLYDLDGLDFGIRATSVGTSESDREGSVKLVGQFDIPEPPPSADNFPTFDKDISYITLYFAQEEGDTRGDFQYEINEKSGKTVEVAVSDGYYTVKIDGWEDQAVDGSDDLDDYLGEIMTWLIANDPYIDADSELAGVAIKGGDVDHGGYNGYYAMDGDTDPDTPPIDLAENKEVDQTYEYTDVFGTTV